MTSECVSWDWLPAGELGPVSVSQIQQQWKDEGPVGAPPPNQRKRQETSNAVQVTQRPGPGSVQTPEQRHLQGREGQLAAGPRAKVQRHPQTGQPRLMGVWNVVHILIGQIFLFEVRPVEPEQC